MQGSDKVAADIDACCLIDLLASGQATAILRAVGYEWHLPVAVESEVRYVRQFDPDQRDQIISVQVDLSPLLKASLLQRCEPENELERNLFVQYATQFRSDGEAMCVALAESRGWIVATDDRKAIRVAQDAGLSVVSCPTLVKMWAERDRPDPATLTKALRNIELFAHFQPNMNMPECQWWLDRLSPGP